MSIAVRQRSRDSISYVTLFVMLHTSNEVRTCLKSVIDPELAISIVDLGLIYDIQFPTDEKVQIVMTLTSLGCPLFGTIHDDMVRALKLLEYTADQIDIELVWDPPWNQSMMSEEAKAELGIE